MKNLLGTIVLIMMCSLVTSLFQGSHPTPSSKSLPTIKPTTASQPQTVTPGPSTTSTAVELPPDETPVPTLLPTIEPMLIPDQLSTSFSVQTQVGINGHNLVSINGWSYGFRPSRYCFGPYEWMDQNHLLLFPLTGQKYGMGTEQLSLPVVINQTSGKVWVPTLDDLFSLSSCQQPFWSNALNVLISTQSGETIVYTSEGDIVDRYPGINPSLSPSGTKLMTGGMWIDLLTGKQVDFASKGINYLSTWSSDENELYSCCYAYGNAHTGQAFTFELKGVRYVGRDYGAGFTGIKNLWVMNDTYVVTYWDFYDDESRDIFPLIEPSKHTYKDLRAITDIPDDVVCRLGSVSPDRKQIWASCAKPNNYWVNLESLAVEPYSSDLNLVSWSSNSDFALMRTPIDGGSFQVLSVLDKKLNELTVNPQIGTLFWHSYDSILAYISEDEQTLVLINARDMSAREMALPTSFHGLAWNPTGSHLALVAEDSSIWQVDYPNLENLEQLTPPLPDVEEMKWSPNGNSIAFVSGANIYIIDTAK